MIARLLLLGCFFLSVPLILRSQAQKDIPVYPSATLDTSHEPGEEPTCCSFSTKDPLEKVVAFYESALKTKALDLAALAAKYPAMKEGVNQMKQQMPAGMQYRVIVFEEEKLAETTMPRYFEIVSAQGRTSISLSDEELGLSGARLVHEYRKATSSMDNLDQSYEDWVANHPLAKQEQFDFPVFPGSLVERVTIGENDVDVHNFNIHGEGCYSVSFCVLDTLAFEKLVAFYKDKLKGQWKIIDEKQAENKSLEMQDQQFFWKPAGNNGEGSMQEFQGKEGDANRYLNISMTSGVPTYPYFDRNQRTRVPGLLRSCIAVDLKSEVLGKCAEIPKEKKRRVSPEGQ